MTAPPIITIRYYYMPIKRIRLRNVHTSNEIPHNNHLILSFNVRPFPYSFGINKTTESRKIKYWSLEILLCVRADQMKRPVSLKLSIQCSAFDAPKSKNNRTDKHSKISSDCIVVQLHNACSGCVSCPILVCRRRRYTCWQKNGQNMFRFDSIFFWTKHNRISQV